MIKYHQAYNSLEELVHINEIEKAAKDGKEKYTCISCGKELIARLGDYNQRHFAHKEKPTCSGETYLHKLGKEIFFQEYKRCLAEKKPFNIELHQKRICNKCEAEFNKTCRIEPTTNVFDLTEYFDHIELEEREGDFIPDLKLSSTQTKKKIFFEIAVTHSCSMEKVFSGYKVIEFKVNEESDLDLIRSHHLCEQHPLLSFYKFSADELKGSMYDEYCDKTFDLFAVFSNGKSFLNKQSLAQIKDFLSRNKESLQYCQVSTSYTALNKKYKSLIAEAFTKGIRIKNCFFCRYHAKNVSSTNNIDSERGIHPIFCKFLKESRLSNDAVSCQYYKPEQKYVTEYLNFEDGIVERLYRNMDSYTEEILLERRYFN